MPFDAAESVIQGTIAEGNTYQSPDRAEHYLEQ